MELIRYNKLTLAKQGGRTAPAKVSISTYGVISFNREAIRMAGLNEGDTVELVQDKNNPEDWYFTKSKVGFMLRKNSRLPRLMCNNSVTCRRFFRSLKEGDKKTLSMPVGTEPTKVDGMELWPIITASIKQPKYTGK
ncbi:MAG: hypothetical protein K9I74_14605 [Bacteroidales bacterium]|nr:hypothetical protein [Bacteroidales bacterium]